MRLGQGHTWRSRFPREAAGRGRGGSAPLGLPPPPRGAAARRAGAFLPPLQLLAGISTRITLLFCGIGRTLKTQQTTQPEEGKKKKKKKKKIRVFSFKKSHPCIHACTNTCEQPAQGNPRGKTPSCTAPALSRPGPLHVPAGPRRAPRSFRGQAHRALHPLFK